MTKAKESQEVETDDIGQELLEELKIQYKESAGRRKSLRNRASLARLLKANDLKYSGWLWGYINIPKDQVAVYRNVMGDLEHTGTTAAHFAPTGDPERDKEVFVRLKPKSWPDMRLDYRSVLEPGDKCQTMIETSEILTLVCSN